MGCLAIAMFNTERSGVIENRAIKITRNCYRILYEKLRIDYSFIMKILCCNWPITVTEFS